MNCNKGNCMKYKLMYISKVLSTLLYKFGDSQIGNIFLHLKIIGPFDFLIFKKLRDSSGSRFIRMFDFFKGRLLFLSHF